MDIITKLEYASNAIIHALHAQKHLQHVYHVDNHTFYLKMYV